MKKQRSRRWLSILLAAAMVATSFAMPVSAESVEAAAESAETRAAVVSTVEATDEREVNFNKNWKFYLDEEENLTGAEEKDYDDSSWDNVTLPHDFSIIQEFSAQYEAESGFLPGGTGWYRKTVTLPSDYADKTLVLNFDGVYNHAYVYVNGTYLGENTYGYNDFSFDISDYVVCDGATENVITVKAVSEYPSSRWYSGSGIYRDVTLLVSGQVHVAYSGTYVTTPNLEEEQYGNVTVDVETTVDNDSSLAANATVITTVTDSDGNVVSNAPASTTVSVAGGDSAVAEQQVYVNQPKLWSCDSPTLYYVVTEIQVNGETMDTYETEFGFRYISYDADTGFYLNGENVKMKGVCMHHDQGALGSASYYDAVYRQVEILKGMGCNAIRTSHNSPSKMLLEICNELGILVMDEVFDGWSSAKNGNTNDFSAHFNEEITSDNQVIGGDEGETWAQFALESTINRDKNNPCVVMWSIGNELPTGVTGSTSNYTSIAANLISWINAIDDTKPITMGDNQYSWSNSDFRTTIDQMLYEAGGVVGLNYYPTMYASKHTSQPSWPLIATETASPANSRGIYSTLSSYSKTGDYQCTAYDTACVSWGNTARESWYYIIANDCVAGEFIWTGFDYIGEPTGAGSWNGTSSGSVVGNDQAVPNSSYFGVIDTAGFVKDSYYFYSSQWLEDTTTLHIVPQSWNEEDLTITNGSVPVYVYSNAYRVELYLNGELIGTSTRKDTTTTAGYTYSTYTNTSEASDICTAVNSSTTYETMAIQYNVQYEEGTLSAKAYDENGNLIEDTYGEASVTTNTDEGTSLVLTADKTEIQADGSSLCYISVDVVDANGEFVSAADNNIRFTLTGNGTIMGVDNGNPSTTDKFQQETVLTSDTSANIDAFSGKALVIVRSTEGAGGFTLKAESTGLNGDKVTVSTVGDVQGDVYIKDYEMTTEYTVKMGTAPQLDETASVTMSDETVVEAAIVWNSLSEETYNTPGEYIITGVLTAGSESIEVEAVLNVDPVLSGFANYSTATLEGVTPSLPSTVSGVLINGDEYGEYPVTWNDVDSASYNTLGDIVTIEGAVTYAGTEYTVYATVRVAETEEKEVKNIAPEYSALTESCGSTADNLYAITDGSYDGSSTTTRWTNWNDHLQSSSPTITFTWSEVQKIDIIKMWFFTDSSVSVPEKVTITGVALDGTEFDIPFTATEFADDAETTFTLDDAYDVKSLKISLTQQGNGYVGLSEVEIYTAAYGYTLYDTAVLDTLTVNDETVEGFTSGEAGQVYTVDMVASDAVVAATAQDNASVTVLPVNSSAIVNVLVKSEDHTTTNLYQIQFSSSGYITGEQISTLTQDISTAEGLREEDYTAESYAALQEALKKAQDILAQENVTEEEAQAALNELQAALNGLVKKGADSSDTSATGTSATQTPLTETSATETPSTVTLPAVGSTYSDGKATYKVTKSGSSADDRTVTYVKPAKKTNTKIAVPATVTINGLSYKVTAIANKAFMNNKKLKQVTVGKNVKSIGTSAFSGDAKLKKIVIKSKVLTKVGKKALKGVYAKCKIKVPKAKKKAYTKLFKGKGQKSTVKIM